jgi:hypothetical protein
MWHAVPYNGTDDNMLAGGGYETVRRPERL